MNAFFRFNFPFYLCVPFASMVFSHLTIAQHQHVEHSDQSTKRDTRLEEIIVTGAQQKTRAETALPVYVLSGEELRKQAASTIGETIETQPGIVSSSFGAGVGQPIIRGLEGNRVMVLENNLATLDASGASPDHASAVEALLAEKIEIVRGPATLLYGNGAIGGVVNVLDNRIPTTLPTKTEGALEVRGNSVNDEKAVVGKLTGAVGNVAWYLDGLKRKTNNVRIPGFAIDESARHQEQEEHEEEAEEEEEEHVENTHGYVANSNTDANKFTLGASYVGDHYFFGIAYSELENEYGLPPGAHAHEHEGEEEDEEEHEEEVIRLAVEQQQTDFKAGIQLEGTVEQLLLDVRVNDYQHSELEGSEIGTVFSNKGIESRLTANHQFNNAIRGVWGLQLADSTFEAIGEEAFIPKTDMNSIGLFAIESFTTGNFIYELGARIDQVELSPDQLSCDAKETTLSGSASVIWRFSDAYSLLFSANRAERAPTVEERYSNIVADAVTNSCAPSAEPVEHLATARTEFGDVNLDNEVSNNLEMGLQKHAGQLRLEANVYYNQFSDYIYLADVEEVDEEITSAYLQDDANFYGIEGQITTPIFTLDNQHLDVTFLADYVYAELDSGEYVARLPPARIGIGFDYFWADWAFNVSGTKHFAQTRLAPDEAETDGYTKIDMSIDYHLSLGEQELLLFLNGNNLTDEEIRDHTSYMKNFAPAPGRGFELGVRYSF